MERSNSNSWKRPLQRDFYNSQDSAISSQGMLNSQCPELSQVCTQDLFGQNSGSQNEKKSMYEKWLKKKSFKRHGSGESVMNSWTPKSHSSSVVDTIPNVGPGRSVSKMYGDHLGQILHSFEENRCEMNSLAINLREMLERMKGTFCNDTKEFISSFMEEISKSHEGLVAHFQDTEKDRIKEKEVEKQIASKDCQISSLESKVAVLEKQAGHINKEDMVSIVKTVQEEIRSSQLLIMTKLAEITDKVDDKKQHICDCKQILEELNEFSSMSNEVYKDVQDSETRILKYLKKIPTDVKSDKNIKSEIRSMLESIPGEVEHSIKLGFDGVSDDVKASSLKDQKKSNEQLRKQFDRMFNKMDAIVDEHKIIQELMEENTSNSFNFNHHVKEINDSMKQLKSKAPSNSHQIKEIEQRMVHCQEKHSQHLQNVIVQQKEFLENIDSLSKKCAKVKECMDKMTASEGNNNFSPKDHPNIEDSVQIKRNWYVRKLFGSAEKNNLELEDKSYNESSNACSTPSNDIIHQVENKVNNISIPVINQTNIYSSHMQHRFKSPLCNLIGANSYLQTNHQCHMNGRINRQGKIDNENGKLFISPFRRPESPINYLRHGPSPIAAVKPQRHIDGSFKVHKESDRYRHELEAGNNNINPTFSKSKLNQNKQNHHYDIDDYQDINKHSYNLRKRIPQHYQEPFLYKRQAYGVSKNREESVLNSKKSECFMNKKRQREKDHKSKQESSKRKHDHSIYDFNDSTSDVPKHFQGLRSLKKKESYKAPSILSSPALTMQLNWAQTPSMMRNKQRVRNPDYSQGRETRHNNLDDTFLSQI